MNKLSRKNLQKVYNSSIRAIYGTILNPQHSRKRYICNTKKQKKYNRSLDRPGNKDFECTIASLIHKADEDGNQANSKKKI